ncbi:hypothetical protein [Micromonospora carbonacea]|uniref:hypothetical protein n=1 Tax=Micromonospora carbonacea TaxID=47853 RepID=UPI003D70DBAD
MSRSLLRLRADAYYVPVEDGIWIRTTDSSFTLRGRAVAGWVERLAPLLDAGVVVDDLVARLNGDQAAYVRHLLDTLEQRRVVRREPVDGTIPPEWEAAFGQQVEYLRHFSADAGRAMAAVRASMVTVVGPADRATPLAAALLDVGFADVTLSDARPSEDLLAMVDELAADATPVRLRSRVPAPAQHLVGVFNVDETDAAMALADRADATGAAAWLGVVRGQAMLVKAHVPGSADACLRCAWRRLVHPAVDVAPLPELGHVPVALAGAVLAQDLFRHVSGAIGSQRRPSGEGVVVDLTRLSVWRTPADPDPTCPRCAGWTGGSGADPGPTAAAGPAPFPEATEPTERLADRLLGARCFGPVTSCGPEALPQVPLAAVRPRLNPVGRPGPLGSAEGPVVVAEDLPGARTEAMLYAVEQELRRDDDAAVGAGFDERQALGRALRHWWAAQPAGDWADRPVEARRVTASLATLAALADHPPVRLARRGDGAWRADTELSGSVIAATAESAVRAALVGHLARGQFAEVAPGGLRVAVQPSGDDSPDPAEQASRAGLTWSRVAVRPLVDDLVVAVTLTRADRAGGA